MKNVKRTDQQVKLGNIYSDKFNGCSYAGNVLHRGGLCPTLRTFQGGNAQPLIVVKNFNHKYNAR